MIYTHDCLDLDRVHGYTGISLTVTTDLMMVKAIARDSHYIKSLALFTLFLDRETDYFEIR